MLMPLAHFGMYICGIILMRCLWPPRLPFSVINRCHLEWWFECVTKDGINNFWIVEFQIVKFHILASTLVLLDLWSCRTFGLAGPSVLPDLNILKTESSFWAYNSINLNLLFVGCVIPLSTERLPKLFFVTTPCVGMAGSPIAQCTFKCLILINWHFDKLSKPFVALLFLH